MASTCRLERCESLRVLNRGAFPVSLCRVWRRRQSPAALSPFRRIAPPKKIATVLYLKSPAATYECVAGVWHANGVLLPSESFTDEAETVSRRRLLGSKGDVTLAIKKKLLALRRTTTKEKDG